MTMNNAFPLMLLPVALAACQTTPTPAQQPDNGRVYSAIGTEPFWSLKIQNGRMTFNNAGEVVAKADRYTARPSFNGWRYVADTIVVDVTFSQCSDGMSEFTYKDSVIVRVGQAKYTGCGGGILPPDDFESTSWRVTSINGVPVGLERNALIAFAGGKFSGTIGCNRMSGSFSYRDKKLAFGPLASTRMGCPDPIAAQETALSAIFSSVDTTVFPGDGSMILKGQDGGTVILQQMM
jgi:heat shock protein HslJ